MYYLSEKNKWNFKKNEQYNACYDNVSIIWFLTTLFLSHFMDKTGLSKLNGLIIAKESNVCIIWSYNGQ